MVDKASRKPSLVGRNDFTVESIITVVMTGRYIRDIWRYLINTDLGTYSTSVFS
jgi:hypothetical protein